MPSELDRRDDQQEFALRYETYLDAVYGGQPGRAALSASMAQAILDRRGRLNTSEQFRLLDCAAGTGFPALDLCWHPDFGDIGIRCCDVDRHMLAQLKARARRTDPTFQIVDLAPRIVGRQPPEKLDQLVLNWSALGRLQDRYDYVLCRGNSLAYADTWSGESDVAKGHRLLHLLKKICDRVRPGGWLHVDAPQTLQLSHRTYAEAEFDGRPCSIWEEVDEVLDTRHWKVRFTVGDETSEFNRCSSKLTIDQLEVLLRDKLGFKEAHTVHLEGERPSFGVIIAQRPL